MSMLLPKSNKFKLSPWPLSNREWTAFFAVGFNPDHNDRSYRLLSSYLLQSGIDPVVVCKLMLAINIVYSSRRHLSEATIEAMVRNQVRFISCGGPKNA